MRKKYLSWILKWITMLGFWIILCGNVSWRTLILGNIAVPSVLFISGYILKRYASNYVIVRHHYHLLWFMGIVFVEIFYAAYHHILRVLSGEDRSVIFEIELDVKDELAAALIANAITLTPGTLTMQMHNSTLTILGFAEDANDIEQIKHVILDRFQKPFLRRDIS